MKTSNIKEVITTTISSAAGGAALVALFSISNSVVVLGAAIAATIGFIASLQQNHKLSSN